MNFSQMPPARAEPVRLFQNQDYVCFESDKTWEGYLYKDKLTIEYWLDLIDQARKK